MAYQLNGKTERPDPYEEFMKAVKAGDLKPSYLIYGPEDHKKSAAVKALCDAVLGDDPFREMNTAVMESPAADEILTAVTTVPFMSGRRVVIVKDFAPFYQKEKTEEEQDEQPAGEDASGGSLKAFAEALGDIPPETCLIFLLRQDVDKRRSAFKAVSKYAFGVECLPADPEQAVKFIARGFKAHGKRITGADAMLMVEACGVGLTALSNEIEKLAAYTDGRDTVERDDILRVCTQNSAFKIFDMSDALLRGDGKQAFAQLRVLEASGEDQPHLIPILGEQCRRVLYCVQLRQQRVPAQEVSKIMGIPPFAVDRNVRMGSRYTPEQLRMFCDWCRERDYEIKSGQVSGKGALEELMLRILHEGRAGKKAAGHA